MNKTIIKSKNRWYHVDYIELYRYRYLIFTFSWRDIKVRYGQTILGLLWILIQPIFSIAILYLIFGKIAGLEESHSNYIPFVLSGIVCWQYFNNVFNEGSQSLFNAQNMITKVYFPKIYLPLAKGFTFVVDLAMTVILLVIISLQYDFLSIVGTFFALVYLFLFTLFATFCGTIGSVLIARFRDLRFVYPFLLQIGLYASPIAYSIIDVPEKYRILILLNPITWFVEGFRNAWMNTSYLEHNLGVCSILTFTSMVVALYSFNKIEPTLADII